MSKPFPLRYFYFKTSSLKVDGLFRFYFFSSMFTYLIPLEKCGINKRQQDILMRSDLTDSVKKRNEIYSKVADKTRRRINVKFVLLLHRVFTLFSVGGNLIRNVERNNSFILFEGLSHFY